MPSSRWLDIALGRPGAPLGLVLLGRVLGMLVVGLATGLVVAWVEERAALVAWWQGGARWTPRAAPPWTTVLVATLYTACAWTSVEGSIRLLRRRPVRSAAQVAGYVAIAGGVGFVVAAGLDAVLGALMPKPEGAAFATVALVTVTTSVVATTLFFTFSFYRGLRDAEAARLVAEQQRLEAEQQRLEAERARTDAELRALRAQINPHFLFNTLNAIAALIRVRPEEAEGTTEHLADLFRYTLHASKQPFVPLADEWAATMQYLAIEQTRFRDRLTVESHLADDARAACVPSLVLQPLVENAVQHGVARTPGACRVTVRARRTDDGAVTLSVRDTGPGFDTTDPDAVLARGTGLANVRDRLTRAFDGDSDLTIHPDGVTLHLPFQPFAAPPPDARPRHADPARPDRG